MGKSQRIFNSASITILISILISYHHTQSQTPDSINCNNLYRAPYYSYFNGYKKNDTLTIDQLIHLGPLLCSNNDFEVISFQLAQIGLGGAYFKHVQGNKIPDEDLKIIKELKYGNRIFFDCIVVKNKIGKAYTIGTLVHPIKPL